MLKTMTMHKLPPQTKMLLRAVTAGLAILVVATGVRVGLVVSGAKSKQAPSSASTTTHVANVALDALGAIPLSSPPMVPKSDAETNPPPPPPPPPLDISGLDLKGVFVNMFDKRKSIAIIGLKGRNDLILKRGDVARNGVMVDEIYPDHVVFRGFAGDTKSLVLTDFIKEAVIVGGHAPLAESLADFEDDMGPQTLDPTSPGPGVAGDVDGDGGMDLGVIKYMPIPKMPTADKGGSQMAAPTVAGSEAARAVSREMNAASHIAVEGQ